MSEEGKRNLGPAGKIDPSEAPVKVLEHRLAYQGYDYCNGYVEQNGAEVPAQEQD